MLARCADVETPSQDGFVALRPEKERWLADGWCVLEGVLPEADVVAAQAALPALFPTAEEFAADADPVRNQPFRIDSHSVLPRFPFDDGALNQLVLHNAILDLAEEFLELTDLRLYQGMVSAKYSGGAIDDEQLLHVDYGNHTLVVPRAEVGYQHLELFIYLTDVTAETAATRMVSRRLTADIPVERTYLSVTDYGHLYEAEVPATGPAGSILAYRPDVYHRGVRMTAPAAARFMLHVSFKPVDTDWLGSQAWPGAAEGMAWHRFMQQATVRQLTALGFPVPGHRYWDEDTLRGVSARYPALDMTAWREAWQGTA
jgi:phytanoyl-CoA dioxygenase PhyH